MTGVEVKLFIQHIGVSPDTWEEEGGGEEGEAEP